jgi:hypothetical protein
MGKYGETWGGLIAARWKVGRLNANSDMLPFEPDEPRELRRLLPGLLTGDSHAAWWHGRTRTDPVLAVERH